MNVPGQACLHDHVAVVTREKVVRLVRERVDFCGLWVTKPTTDVKKRGQFFLLKGDLFLSLLRLRKIGEIHLPKIKNKRAKHTHRKCDKGGVRNGKVCLIKDINERNLPCCYYFVFIYVPFCAFNHLEISPPKHNIHLKTCAGLVYAN